MPQPHPPTAYDALANGFREFGRGFKVTQFVPCNRLKKLGTGMADHKVLFSQGLVVLCTSDPLGVCLHYLAC